MTRLVGPERVIGVGMPKGMAQERYLTMVQIRSTKESLGLTALSSLPRQVGVELTDCAADDMSYNQMLWMSIPDM